MPKKTTINFTEAFGELEKLIAWFESPEFNLDEGLEKFEQALKLAADCRARLKEVDNTVISLKKRYNEEDNT